MNTVLNKSQAQSSKTGGLNCGDRSQDHSHPSRVVCNQERSLGAGIVWMMCSLYENSRMCVPSLNITLNQQKINYKEVTKKKRITFREV